MRLLLHAKWPARLLAGRACTCLLAMILLLGPMFVPESAFAEGSCPPVPDVPINPTYAEWLKIRDRLSESWTECINDPSFLALYGAALMHTFQMAQAIETLERALLISPDNGGALIDYAAALFYSGELISAIEINRQLLEREDVPVYLQGMLQQRQDAWEAKRVHWEGNLAILGGYHDNLNGVADLRNLTLTVDGEELELALDDSSSPIAGGYASTRLAIQRINHLDEGYSRFLVALQNRTTELHRVDSDELMVSYERHSQLENGSRLWNVHSSYLYYGDEELYISLGARFTRYWDFEKCSPFLEMRTTTLHFPVNRYLDEASVIAGGGVRCGGASNRLTISGFGNYNTALDERPGEDRAGAELNIKWQFLWGQGILVTQLAGAVYEDHEGYSPLLDNNDERKMTNSSLSIQYIYPLTKSVSFHTGYYYRNQKSNIDLFDTRSTNVDVGFSISF